MEDLAAASTILCVIVGFSRIYLNSD